MTVKNLGAGVSGYLNPDGRNWETAVYQASKPVLDKELNLTQDAEQELLSRIRRRSYPSGWVSEDFLTTSSSTSGVQLAVSGVANQLIIPACEALVNGWHLKIVNTGTSSTDRNLIALPASPAGAGAKRTDLVVLEVWRRLLSAASSTVGKSPAARIWLNGNVKIASADDLTLNFADDILDVAVGSETTKRVQVQYRLRVISGIDLFGFPYGMTDPNVFAYTVPASAAAPDGTATAYTYANQSGIGDPGLWLAGDGNPANGLGTVDGYMYALPLMAVFRRNTTAFARNTNHNGGVALSVGTSDRPDGLYYDVVTSRDIVDLRSGTAPSGWNLDELVQKNMHLLFDNAIRTEIGSTTIGGGVAGSAVLWADEIGVSNTNGGDGVITGDTPGAEFIGEFDGVRRRYSDRSVYETVVLRYVPSNGSGGGPNWVSSDTITINPTALPVFPGTAFNWSAYNPSTITIVDIQKVMFVGDTAGQNMIETKNWKITGLGAVPQTNLTLTVGTLPSIAGPEPIYVYATVAYPTGLGLTKTPTATFANSLSINNPGQLPAGAPIRYEAIQNFAVDTPHREVNLQYRTSAYARTFYKTVANDVLTMPERVQTISGITINAGAYGGSITIDSTGFLVTLAGGSINPGDVIVVTYKAVRPLPQNGEQVTIYYEANAAQTVRDSLLGTSLALLPRYVAPYMYVLTAGSASVDEAYPYPSQYVQVGGVYPTSAGTFAGDHELDGSARLSVTTLFADTGFMQLPVHIPIAFAPEGITFTRSGGDIDAEGRSYFKTVSGTYGPTAIGPTLSDPKRHKNVLPMICELAVDSPVGFKGQLVLVLLSRQAFDDSNSVSFISTLTANRTTASVYRLKGNLLNNRRS